MPLWEAVRVDLVALSPGTRLGPYAISGPLGAGGMGEVYKARDTRLERIVAIKVLREHLSRSVEFQKRFEREARVISSLNHPHICTLYDIGQQDGTDFLVMEYLEGETLAERLQKGALPTDQALRTAIEVADALDRAHRAGVIHRDLKPGNVMLTKSGAKLLDFGLAKLHGAEPPADDAEHSAAPTQSLLLTGERRVMGTFPYMAPEQVEGKGADGRTDLFAFGAVLYEMLTGKRAFRGETEASLIGAILHSEPESLSTLQPMTPQSLDRVVRRCLAKDPDDRWQTARDLAIELKWIAEGGDGTGVAAALPIMARKKRWRFVIGAAVVAAGAIAVTAVVTRHLTRPTNDAAPVVFSVPAQPASVFTFGFAISPDGRNLAINDADSTGNKVFLRPIGSEERRAIEGTEAACMLFWSPDSRYVGFFTDAGKLKTIPASGGNAKVLCDAVQGHGGTWNRQGDILFAPGPNGPLYRVPATGGEPVQVTTLDSTRHELAHRWPCFLPDGRHFLYAVAPPHQGEWDTYVGSLDSPERRLLLSGSGAAAYAAPGYVLYPRNQKLMAQRFDAGRLQLQGEPVAIPDAAIGTPDTLGQPAAVASANGVVVSLNNPLPNTQMVWVDRRGSTVGAVDAPLGSYQSLAVAPDNRRIAVTRVDATGNRDIWVVDPVLGASRLTFDAAADDFPLWSRDGRRIYFCSWRSGVGAIYQKPADGSQPEELVYEPTSYWAAPSSESPDGRFLAFTMPTPGTDADVWLLPLSGPRVPVPFVQTPSTDIGGDISPDGHWATYESGEFGVSEVYVQSFPTPGKRFQISTGGGGGPVWTNGGREIQYSIPPDKIMAIDVQTSPTFQAGKPHVLFTINKDWGISAVPDGQHFVMEVPPGDAPASTYGIMLNWTAALK